MLTACYQVAAGGREFFGFVELAVCGLNGRGSGEDRDKGEIASKRPGEGRLERRESRSVELVVGSVVSDE